MLPWQQLSYDPNDWHFWTFLMGTYFHTNLIGGSKFFISHFVWFLQRIALKQYFRVALFITLYKVVLTWKSVDETMVWSDSNESYRKVLSCGTVCYTLQVGSNLKPVDETLVCDDHSTKSNCAVLSSGTAFLLCCVYVARPHLTQDTWCQKVSDCFSISSKINQLDNFAF